jgi:hypothetical protein
VKGRLSFPEPAFVRHGTALIPIEHLDYEIPINVTTEEITIQADGVPKVLVKYENGRIDTLVTDAQLKKIRFTDDGEVLFDDGSADASITRGPTTSRPS